MDSTNKPEQNNAPGKKEMRKQLADKIAVAIPELKTTLGEKKFDHRIKKAVKIIADGLHKKERVKVAKKVKVVSTAKAVKTATPKKAATKKKAKSAGSKD